MARNIDYPKAGLDRCKYYKAEYVNGMKLTKDATVQGVFYANDIEPITKRNYVMDASKNIQTIAKIETIDYIPDITIDDYVLYDGDLYLVDEVSTADINDNAKEFRRHAIKTILTLRR